MRSRFLVLALALDALCGLAVPAVFPAIGGATETDQPRYQQVAGTCVEVAGESDGMLMGRPVADVWCAATAG